MNSTCLHIEKTLLKNGRCARKPKTSNSIKTRPPSSPSPPTTDKKLKYHILTKLEIILPHNCPNYLRNESLFVIECGTSQIVAEVTPENVNSRRVEAKSEISILRSLLDLHGIQYGGTFKGHIQVLSPNKYQEHSLEIVELLVKNSYFSRRDQYKVTKRLRETTTHVYLKKVIYFDEVHLEVSGIMKTNNQPAKSGLIDRNTKIVFRTNCSKLSVGIELALETFELDEGKKSYLEKMIEFLRVYLTRNLLLGSGHRLTIIFYGRCYYPQFRSLHDAYNYLLKESTMVGEIEKNEVNFAIALQKDHRGRIYQDFFRRILWNSENIGYFREFVWQKITQVMYTLNWDQEQYPIGTFIRKNLHDKIQGNSMEGQLGIEKEDKRLKVKPFVHKLKCVLASSKDSNLFEAMALISEQYRHHYKFRCLSETGNSIIMLSAGGCSYEVDFGTFRMAKSYIYLTNVSVSLVNVRTLTENKLIAEVVEVDKPPIYRKEDSEKMRLADINCIEKQVYLSPGSCDIPIREYFQNKNYVYPEELEEISCERGEELRQKHHCMVEKHTELVEKVELSNIRDYKIKPREVEFVAVYCLDNQSLSLHNYLYDKSNSKSIKLPELKPKPSELDIFNSDLERVVVGKQEWNLHIENSEIEKNLQKYRSNIDKMTKHDREPFLHKTSLSIFRITNEVEERPERDLIETTSNNDAKIESEEMSLYSNPIRVRKRSEFISIEELDVKEGKVNIFEETWRNKNHEYNAKEKSFNNKGKKETSHNKERLKNNYLDSNVHYLMPQFNEITFKKFRAFVRNEYVEELKDQEESIRCLFEMEKMWKNLCFPLLFPIYTKYIEVLLPLYITSPKSRSIEILATQTRQQTRTEASSKTSSAACE